MQFAVSCSETLTTLHFDRANSGNRLSQALHSHCCLSLLALLHWQICTLYNHFHFSADIMSVASLNFLGIYCELDAFLCSVLLLVSRCGSVRLPCDCSKRVVALGASGEVCFPNSPLFLGCKGHKDLQRCQAAGLQLWPCLPNIL